MNIVLEIKENEVGLSLKDGDILVDKTGWTGKFDLSEKLLVGIDKFIAKNGLKVENIKKMSVESHISDNLTTVRIAETVAKTFNFYNEVD
ncbi:MAG: hypothetical protein RBS77_01275 [Candidatus Moranbacteria bacterium]|jgi:hypothetical protein|nr:hypothetical protein [Candidatus Moranbacteria bacterium]